MNSLHVVNDIYAKIILGKHCVFVLEYGWTPVSISSRLFLLFFPLLISCATLKETPFLKNSHSSIYEDQRGKDEAFSLKVVIIYSSPPRT